MGFIYVIQNTVNQKIYVGQTTRNIDIRWREHRNNKNRLLSTEIKKYGINKFSFILINEVSNNNLDYEETRIIKKFNSLHPYGYNIELEQSFTYSQSAKGGLNEDGHDKQSLVTKEKYKLNPKLKDLGNVPRGISFRFKKSNNIEGFVVRKKGIKYKEFMSSVSKNNLQYNLDRAIQYLSLNNKEY